MPRSSLILGDMVSLMAATCRCKANGMHQSAPGTTALKIVDISLRQKMPSNWHPVTHWCNSSWYVIAPLHVCTSLHHVQVTGPVDSEIMGLDAGRGCCITAPVHQCIGAIPRLGLRDSTQASLQSMQCMQRLQLLMGAGSYGNPAGSACAGAAGQPCWGPRPR